MVRTALLMTDSVWLRQVVSFALGNAGYEVIDAADEKRALNELRERKVGIVILVGDMKETDAADFISTLRKTADHRFTPILLITSEPRGAEAARRTGASGWLIRPFTHNQLIEVVNRLLR